MQIFGDGYITLRYKMGLPIVPEGETPVSLFWLLDALVAAGVTDSVQSHLLWPLIAGSVITTELASTVGNLMLKNLQDPAAAVVTAAAAAIQVFGSKAKPAKGAFKKFTDTVLIGWL